MTFGVYSGTDSFSEVVELEKRIKRLLGIGYYSKIYFLNIPELVFAEAWIKSLKRQKVRTNRLDRFGHFVGCIRRSLGISMSEARRLPAIYDFVRRGEPIYGIPSGSELPRFWSLNCTSGVPYFDVPDLPVVWFMSLGPFGVNIPVTMVVMQRIAGRKIKEYMKKLPPESMLNVRGLLAHSKRFPLSLDSVKIINEALDNFDIEKHREKIDNRAMQINALIPTARQDGQFMRFQRGDMPMRLDGRAADRTRMFSSYWGLDKRPNVYYMSLYSDDDKWPAFISSLERVVNEAEVEFDRRSEVLVTPFEHLHLSETKIRAMFNGDRIPSHIEGLNGRQSDTPKDLEALREDDELYDL